MAMLMEREQSCLVIIDVQERLVPAMSDPRRVIFNSSRLMRAAARLGVPMVVSEQYPKGIGPTVADLADYLPKDGVVAKTHFSLTTEEEPMRLLAAASRRQMILTGVEAHVCVLQTALGLKNLDYQVFVVADAIASRKSESETLAMDRMRQAGIAVVNTEMVLFEWLKASGTAEFKDLMPLIK